MLTSLSARLVPYFVMRHPSRGQVYGPFRDLTRGLKVRTLELVLTMSTPERGELYRAARDTVGYDDLSEYRRILANSD